MRAPSILAAFALVACTDPVAVAPLAKPNESKLIAAGPLNGVLPTGNFVLTFDDGPTDATLPIAQYLHDEGIRATFFVEGTHGLGQGPLAGDPNPITGYCSSAPGRHAGQAVCDPNSSSYILAQLVALGHSVGNHTVDHPDLASLSSSAVVGQVTTMHPLLLPFMRNWLFRAPYGSLGAAQPYSVVTALQGDSTTNRYTGPIQWTNDASAQDWACSETSPVRYFNPTLTPAQCADTYVAFYTDPTKPKSGFILRHDWLEFINQADWWTVHDPPGVAQTSQTSMYAYNMTVELVQQMRAAISPLMFVPIDAAMDPLPAGATFPGGERFSNFQSWLSGGFPVGSSSRVFFGDISHDGKADVCGRFSDGIHCGLSTGNAFAATTSWISSQFTDYQGWNASQYQDTIQLGDVTGDGYADICGRGFGGIYCAASVRGQFTGMTLWSADFSDAQGWNAAAYYRTIRLADVNGDHRVDVCARGYGGIYCALSTGSSFGPLQLWLVNPNNPSDNPFSDADGWSTAEFYESIQFSDINHDGRADVCGRSYAGGMICATATLSGNAFDYTTMKKWSAGVHFPNMADADGVGQNPSFYETVRLGDIDGDHNADVCYRAALGVLCGQSNGSSFGALKVWEKLNMSDVGGWSDPSYASTMQLVDVNGDGRSDLCARGYGGTILCGLGTAEPLF